MNYIKEVVEKVLPVDVGEEFNIILNDGRYCTHNPFKFTETDLVNNDGDINNNYIIYLISGYYIIERLPFRPKRTEVYYAIIHNTATVSYHWADTTADYERLIAGLVFRTREEAEAYIPTWIERINTL